MKTLEELLAVKERSMQKIAARENANDTSMKHVLVCGGTGCTSSNSGAIIDELNSQIAQKGLEGKVKVVRTGCFGLCALGPIMIVYPEGSFYSQVKVEDIPEIVEEHFVKGNVVTRLLYQETVTDNGIKSLNETNFYKKQHRVALRNCGVIDPEDIEEYIAVDGYHETSNPIVVIIPVMTFILCGFDHCIANFGYMGMYGNLFVPQQLFCWIAGNSIGSLMISRL